MCSEDTDGSGEAAIRLEGWLFAHHLFFSVVILQFPPPLPYLREGEFMSLFVLKMRRAFLTLYGVKSNYRTFLTLGGETTDLSLLRDFPRQRVPDPDRGISSIL
jgi:hypothetical protein